MKVYKLLWRLEISTVYFAFQNVNKRNNKKIFNYTLVRYLQNYAIWTSEVAYRYFMMFNTLVWTILTYYHCFILITEETSLTCKIRQNNDSNSPIFNWIFLIRPTNSLKTDETAFLDTDVYIIWNVRMSLWEI